MSSTLHIQKQKTKNEKLRIRNEKHCHTCLHDDINRVQLTRCIFLVVCVSPCHDCGRKMCHWTGEVRNSGERGGGWGESEERRENLFNNNYPQTKSINITV